MKYIRQDDFEYLINKYHDASAPFDPHKRRAYHGYEYDPSTGLSDEEITQGLSALAEEQTAAPHPVAKARAIAYVLKNTRIDVPEHDYFVGIYTWDQRIQSTTLHKWKEEVFRDRIPEIDRTMKDLNESGAVTIWPDFDHVVPDWDSLTHLGFVGIRTRAREYRALH